MHPHVHSSIIYNGQDMRTTKVSIHGWIYIYIINIYTHTHKYTQWNIIQPWARRKSCYMITWMDLQGIVLSEISQTEKDKYCIINYMWNLKKTNSEKQRVEWWPVGVGGGGSPKNSKKQNLNLPCTRNYLHSIYIVFGIISNLEMIWSIQEAMCRLHANTTSFYMRHLSIPRFWYPQGVLEPIPTSLADTEG